MLMLNITKNLKIHYIRVYISQSLLYIQTFYLLDSSQFTRFLQIISLNISELTYIQTVHLLDSSPIYWDCANHLLELTSIYKFKQKYFEETGSILGRNLSEYSIN